MKPFLIILGILGAAAAEILGGALILAGLFGFDNPFGEDGFLGLPKPAARDESTSGGDGATGWEIETVDAAAGRYGGKCSLALDGRGRPHIAYWSSGKEPDISYARWDEEGWSVQTLDDSVNGWGCEITIRLDREDRPHIVYSSSAYSKNPRSSCRYTYACKYARPEGGKWRIDNVAAGEGDAPRLALALDNDGAANLAFLRRIDDTDNYRIELSYGRYDGNAWEWELLATPPYFSDQLSIFLAGGTEPYVLNGPRFFVRRDGRWQERGIPFHFGSRALDAHGRLHVAFHDDGLIYGRQTEAGWDEETVDVKWEAGCGASLALDRDGLPHISYFNDYDLRFAHFTGEEWVVGALEEYHRPLEHDYDTSLAVDDEGHPTIAYFDPFSGALKCARWRGGEWLNPPASEADANKDLTAAGEIVSWYLEKTAGVPEDPRHPRWLLKRDDIYAEPDDQAEVLLRIEEPTEAEFLDARSVRKSYEDMAGETWASYDAWVEVKVGDVVGWVRAYSFFAKDYSNPALVRFAKPYAPLREGPSEEAPVAREDVKPGDRWRVGASAAAGQYFFLAGKVADWYCIDRGYSEIWVPADAPGLELFYLTYAWHPTGDSDFWFYLPGDEEVGRVFYLVDTYLGSRGLPWKEPRLEVVAAGETFELVPLEIGYAGGYECVDYYFEFAFPHPVRREDIEAITFSVGDEGERVYFTVDPHDAWREPATERHWPSRGMA